MLADQVECCFHGPLSLVDNCSDLSPNPCAHPPHPRRQRTHKHGHTARTQHPHQHIEHHSFREFHLVSLPFLCRLFHHRLPSFRDCSHPAYLLLFLGCYRAHRTKFKLLAPFTLLQFCDCILQRFDNVTIGASCLPRMINSAFGGVDANEKASIELTKRLHTVVVDFR